MHKVTPMQLVVLAVAAVAACSTDSLSEPANGSVAKSLAPPPPSVSPPFFVIGDAEPHAVGDTVNFWGSQWWKNNAMIDSVSSGVAAFKGFTGVTSAPCGGSWTALTGNSSAPPDVIPADVAIIVTGSALKDGPAVSGSVKQILIVHQDGNYAPNVGHAGGGVVTQVICP